jgi:DHA1 family tetracycline resistance protein-like MFS transporter
MTVFLDLLGFGIVIPILPTYAERYGATGLAVGLLGTTYSAMQLVFSPFWGRLSDRVGRRPVLLASAAAGGVAYVVFGLADSLAMLFVARAIGGACAANISTAQAYIADVTTPENRARGMAIIGAGFGLGFTFGPALGGLGSHFLGDRAPFFIAAGLTVVNVVWMLVALAEPTEHRVTRRRDLRSYADAFRTPSLAFYLVAFMVLTFAFSNIESTFALFNHARLGFQERGNGYVFMYIGIVLTVVQGVGTRRLVARFGERRLIGAGTALQAAGAAILPFVHSIPVLLAGTTLIACGNALTSPSMMSTISRAAPADRQGETLGVAQSMGAFGRILGPAAGGYLFDLSRSRSLPYVCAAALLLVLAVSAGLAARTDTPTGQ